LRFLKAVIDRLYSLPATGAVSFDLDLNRSCNSALIYGFHAIEHSIPIPQLIAYLLFDTLHGIVRSLPKWNKVALTGIWTAEHICEQMA